MESLYSSPIIRFKALKDIDIALIRGAYVIKELKIEKIENNSKKDTIPFLTTPEIDLSVEWKSLFKGSVVGEVYIENPVLNFVKGKHKGEDIKADTSDFNDVDEALRLYSEMNNHSFKVANKPRLSDYYVPSDKQKHY